MLALPRFDTYRRLEAFADSPNRTNWLALEYALRECANALSMEVAQVARGAESYNKLKAARIGHMSTGSGSADTGNVFDNKEIVARYIKLCQEKLAKIDPAASKDDGTVAR